MVSPGGDVTSRRRGRQALIAQARTQGLTLAQATAPIGRDRHGCGDTEARTVWATKEGVSAEQQRTAPAEPRRKGSLRSEGPTLLGHEGRGHCGPRDNRSCMYQEGAKGRRCRVFQPTRIYLGRTYRPQRSAHLGFPTHAWLLPESHQPVTHQTRSRLMSERLTSEQSPLCSGVFSVHRSCQVDRAVAEAVSCSSRSAVTGYSLQSASAPTTKSQHPITAVNDAAAGHMHTGRRMFPRLTTWTQLWTGSPTSRPVSDRTYS